MLESAGVSEWLVDNVHAVADHFGVSRGEVFVAPQQGQVNLAVYLGQDLVLRIPRKPAVEERLAKEAAVIPIVQSAGVPTAGLVSYDTSHRIAAVSYMVLERLHGPTLSEFGYDPTSSVRAHASLGEILVPLHSLRMEGIGSIPGVQEPSTLSPERLVERLCEAGEVGSTQGQRLLDWFGHLEANGAAGSDPVLLHGDVIPSNLLVDRSGQVVAIIDWGSASWGDLVRDFADMPTRALPGIITGYRSAARSRSANIAPSGQGEHLEAGALWYQLFWALAKLLGDPSTSEERNWSAPREARLLELLRFLSTDPPEPWPSLLHGSTLGT